MQNKAVWIWHEGDFEIYHSLLLHTRREKRGGGYPCFWNTDSPYATVSFYKDFTCENSGYLTVKINGMGYLTLDRKRYEAGERVFVEKGSHSVEVCTVNINGLPAIFVQSDVCPSDSSWQCSHRTLLKFPVGCMPEYTDSNMTPETFLFSYKNIVPTGREDLADGVLYDFGTETFAKLKLSGLAEEDSLTVCYGESKEEALDGQYCDLTQSVSGQAEYNLKPRAFRYIALFGSAVQKAVISADYEYLPLEYLGSFSSGDEMVNKIWDTAAYTFHLNSREFFLDGIKRDRWVWSGDAYQSYMVNNYLFFDKEITKRTIIALRGKDPVEQHINTILDYSFFWIISLYDYYFNYGDILLIQSLYRKAASLLDFCLESLDQNGFVVGKPGVWVFIDWASIDKDGAISAEQILFWKTLECMADMAELLGEDGSQYKNRATTLKKNINKFYWDEEQGAFIDSYTSGKKHITRHANIFALLYNFVDGDKHQSIINNVLLNDKIDQITTPYFKFFELDVMCRIGQLRGVTEQITEYWGGMIKLGATTVWEQYDPKESGLQHYAMYGEKYGKSLCHAWGAGPIYLFGKYYLGVSATSPGYKTFLVEPQLGGLPSVTGTAPILNGTASVSLSEAALKVLATRDGGTVRYNGKEYRLEANQELVIENNSTTIG